MMTKSQSLRIHFKRRAKERYGLTLNKRELRNIVQMVQNGKSKFLEHCNNRVKKHEIVFQETKLIVLYDKIRKVVITCLSP